MTTYRITHWDTDYETSESRKLEFMRWVPMPNRQDDLVFRRVQLQRNRCELLAAWFLMVQVASKGRRGSRGRLEFEGRPLSADDLSMITGVPAAIFSTAIAFYSSAQVGWLTPCAPATPGASAATPAAPARPPVDAPGTSAEPAAIGQGGQGGDDRTGEDREDKPRARRAAVDSVSPADQPEPIQSRMLKVNALKARQSSTRWSAKEFAAFKAAGLHEMPDGDFFEQCDPVTAYYAEPADTWREHWRCQPGDDFRRRDLLTLLNNWPGEVDRARAAVHWLYKKSEVAGAARL